MRRITPIRGTAPLHIFHFHFCAYIRIARGERYLTWKRSGALSSRGREPRIHSFFLRARIFSGNHRRRSRLRKIRRALTYDTFMGTRTKRPLQRNPSAFSYALLYSEHEKLPTPFFFAQSQVVANIRFYFFLWKLFPQRPGQTVRKLFHKHAFASDIYTNFAIVSRLGYLGKFDAWKSSTRL